MAPGGYHNPFATLIDFGIESRGERCPSLKGEEVPMHVVASRIATAAAKRARKMLKRKAKLAT